MIYSMKNKGKKQVLPINKKQIYNQLTRSKLKMKPTGAIVCEQQFLSSLSGLLLFSPE